jgi:glycosyltransferase involved in cell wall biosynthesis
MGQDLKLDNNIPVDHLSFFIPTYKRELPLRESISSIFEYWKSEKIHQIIVSDNNGGDTALNVVYEFDQKYINYSPNKVNVGIDRNMIKFLELCESRYCWLLGDDDQLTKDSYEHILPLLNEDLDFIILLDGNPIPDYPGGVYEVHSNDEVGRLLMATWDKLPFGNIVVNVERAKQMAIATDISKYIGTSHAYSGILWETLLSPASSHRVAIVDSKCVEVGIVQKTWTDSSIIIHLIEIPRWFALLPEAISIYKNKALSQYLNLIFNISSLFSYVKFARLNKNNRTLMKDALLPFPFSIKLKLKLANILFPLYKVYKRLRTSDSNS